MRVLKLVGMAALALALSGCGTRYTYNNQRFKSADLALQSQDETLATLKSGVKESSMQFPGRALVITPDVALVAQVGVSSRGRPRKELIDYVAGSVAKDLAAYADYLRASKIFANVEAQVSSMPKPDAMQAATRYDAVIFPVMDSPGVTSWFLLAGGSALPRYIATGAPAAGGISRPDVWLESVASNYQAANTAAAVPSPGATPKLLSSKPAQAAAYDECMRRILKIQDAQLRLQSLTMCDGVAK